MGVACRVTDGDVHIDRRGGPGSGGGGGRVVVGPAGHGRIEAAGGLGVLAAGCKIGFGLTDRASMCARATPRTRKRQRQDGHRSKAVRQQRTPTDRQVEPAVLALLRVQVSSCPSAIRLSGQCVSCPSAVR